MNSLFSFVLLSIFLLSSNFINAQGKKHIKKKHTPHVLERRIKRPVYTKQLPAKHSVIKYRSNSYHYSYGNYYVYKNNRYRLTYPRRGLRVQRLPVGYRTIIIGNTNRYYYKGIFYSNVDNEFEVIDPPLGSIVPDIPLENSTVILIDGKSFYQYNLILFEPVSTPDGVQYRVIEKYDE